MAQTEFDCGSVTMPARDMLAMTAPIGTMDAAAACGFRDMIEALTDDSRRTALFAVMAMMRYEYADAMLAARSQPGA